MDDDSLTGERLDSFFDDLDFRFKTVSELDLYLANRFNVFRYIRPDENEISEIIRDLLDPRGVHGQGDAFLRDFLEVIRRPQSGDLQGVVAKCEERTTYSPEPLRRIDLTVGFGRRFGVGIENKPWAAEQPGWVKDYSAHLSNRFDNFVLVFVTPNGMKPEGAEDAQRAKELYEQDRFLRFSYRAGFTDWLEACCRDCCADRVRTFLRDFIDYARVIEGANMASQYEVSTVVDYLRKNPRRLNLASLVRGSLPEAIRQIAEEFLGALKDRLTAELPHGWQVRSTQPRPLENYTNIQIVKPEWRERHVICLEAQRPECADFIIGVWKNAKSVPSIPGLNAEMCKQTGIAGSQNDWWEWRSKVDNAYRNWNAPDTMEKLLAKDEPALKYFADWFLKVRRIAEPLIDDHYQSPAAT